MKQTTILDFIDDFFEEVVAEAKMKQAEKEAEMDETPTVNLEDYLDNEDSTSLLEDVINNFLENCLLKDKLPTLEEAQVIVMLDNLLEKYNAN